MEEEIDLRQYIEVILKRWYWIVGISLVAAILTYFLSNSLAPVYEAEAKVLILRAQTDISFEPTIRSEVGGQNVRDYQQTLVSLVKSNNVASAILDSAQELLGDSELDVDSLLGKVDTENLANLITIKVTNKNPSTAAELTNLWIEAYEAYVNRLYSNQGSEILKEIKEQVAEADSAYRSSQDNLEQFLLENQITTYERNLQFMKEELNAKYAVLQTGLEAKQTLLTQKYADVNKIEGLLNQAQAIQAQFKVSSASTSARTGDTMSLFLLKQQIFSDPTFVRVQINLAEIADQPASVDDVDNVISILKAQISLLHTEIDELTSRTLEEQTSSILANGQSEMSQPIQSLAEQISTVETALAAQMAKRLELTTARDDAWENHKAINRKLAELTLDSQLTDSQVRIASLAIVPTTPISPRPAFNALVVGAFMLMLAILAAFVIEYWYNSDSPTEEVPHTSPETLAPTN